MWLDDCVPAQIKFPLEWQPKELGTLVYIFDGRRVLLIDKLRGHGAGKVNVPGGRVETGEDIEACAVRETREEVCVEVERLALRGFLRFHDTENGFDMTGYVFTTRSFAGVPTATAEADPFWCEVDAIPFDRMWEDDALWLPPILAGRSVRADLVFANDRLISHDVREVDSLRL